MKTKATQKTWLSPAKINLFLYIISKRRDGCHNIQTIFQLLDYYDELTFTSRDDGVINRISDNKNITKDKDLITLSAIKLQQKTNTKLGADISINKKIPIGSGLGGGSSNAATTLIALNKLWNTNLSRQQLVAIGLELGADVPIFITGRSCWAEGIGEIITPITLPKHYFLLVFIYKAISTKKVFQHKALTTTERIGKMTYPSKSISLHNDCLTAAIELESEICKVLEHLKLSKNHLEEPRITGTGSCVFVEFKNEKDAQIALMNLPKKWLGIKAQAINTSPTYNWAVAKR